MNLNRETSSPQGAFTLVARDGSEGRGKRQGPNTASKKKREGGVGGDNGTQRTRRWFDQNTDL